MKPLTGSHDPAESWFLLNAMPKSAATLSFWGVRGSTPTVDRDTWRYGGNTPCLELTAPDGSQFILDCGTGLRMLGKQLANNDDPVRANIFVTHYHLSLIHI